jgi:hypothetical protein
MRCLSSLGEEITPVLISILSHNQQTIRESAGQSIASYLAQFPRNTQKILQKLVSIFKENSDEMIQVKDHFDCMNFDCNEFLFLTELPLIASREFARFLDPSPLPPPCVTFFFKEKSFWCAPFCIFLDFPNFSLRGEKCRLSGALLRAKFINF